MVRSEHVILSEGFKYLTEKLGVVETEYFVFALKRDAFDYTQWREQFFADAYQDGSGTQLERFLHEAASHFPQPSIGVPTAPTTG